GETGKRRVEAAAAEPPERLLRAVRQEDDAEHEPDDRERMVVRSVNQSAQNHTISSQDELGALTILEEADSRPAWMAPPIQVHAMVIYCDFALQVSET